MYTVKVFSKKNEQAEMCLDTYKAPDLHAVRSILKAYDILGEIVISVEVKYAL